MHMHKMQMHKSNKPEWTTKRTLHDLPILPGSMYTISFLPQIYILYVYTEQKYIYPKFPESTYSTFSPLPPTASAIIFAFLTSHSNSFNARNSLDINNPPINPSRIPAPKLNVLTRTKMNAT